ncbi:MAG TPA: hypothetical protein VGF28_23645 [Thermoanaerobaculia bacterium]|jgi:hypothetical protein
MKRTNSATIKKAPRVVVRQHEFWKAYDEFAKEAAKGDFFDPDYVKERWPEVHATLKKKRSADEKRLPRVRNKAK